MEKTAAKSLYREKRKRVWELDFLRGFAVIAMCFDHLMFDCSHPWGFFSNFWEVDSSVFNKIYDFASWYWGPKSTSGFRFSAHYIFLFVFLFLVGTSCAFSRDNTRRGALCGIAAVTFTGITYACKAFGFMEDGVVFGILHCIAMCILLAAALDVLTGFNKYVNRYAPLVIGAVILFVGIGLQFWEWGYPRDTEFISEHFLSYMFGKYSYGDDWFPIVPYVGAVLIGMYWGKAAYARRESLVPMLDGKWHKPITFVGRHAMWFYFFHQPVLVVLFILFGLCFGFRM